MEFLELGKRIPLWVANVCTKVPMTRFSREIVITCSKGSVTYKRATTLARMPAGHPSMLQNPERVSDTLQVAQVGPGLWAPWQLCGLPCSCGAGRGIGDDSVSGMAESSSHL